MTLVKTMMLVLYVAIAMAWAIIGWMSASGSGPLAIATLVLASSASLTVPLFLIRIADLSKRIEELERS